jgi:adenosylcobinamide kinase/adenosylcobinamide-phosphate guanylyltransferase
MESPIISDLTHGRSILITGGARSGKTLYAEKRTRELGPRRVYIATAEAKDEEMTQRIAAHRCARGGGWRTIEEPVELTGTLLERRGQADCVLVDCLTLWMTNLLLQRNCQEARRRVRELCEAMPRLDFHLLLVSNEVGWGIVPENPLARDFRDLLGWANQMIAAVADEVVLMVSGIPVEVKGSHVSH